MTSDKNFIAAMMIVLTTVGCSPVRVFNAVMPKDAGAVRIAQGLPFDNGPRHRLDLYAPRGPATTRPLAIIVFFYGGSWNSGTRKGYAFVGRALAARGFLVAIPDYRLVPQVRYPAFLEDNVAAVRWVRAHAAQWGADPDRVVLAGHSAGAYNAAMLALDPRWLGSDRQAVRGLIGLAGPYDFLPFDSKVAQEAFAGTADPITTQPIHYANAGAPPSFLATGSKDTLVRPHNSDALAEALRARGVMVERRTYPGVGHVGLVTAIAKPLRGKADVLEDMAAFARRVTQ